MVAGDLLPAHTPTLGDQLQVAIALRGGVLCRLAWHRGRTRRHDTAASGWRSATAPYSRPVVSPIAGERSDPTGHLVQQRSDLGAVIDLVVVSSAATISPVAASTPRCSLRQDRRFLVPCFSVSHSPGPPNLRPVLSTSRCNGSDVARGRRKDQGLRPPADGRVIGHGKLETEQAEDGADQPFRLAQRQAKHGPQRQRGQDRQCRVVRLAAWVVRGSARQAAIAASVNQTVRLPRCRKAASYSAQFVTLCRCFRM